MFRSLLFLALFLVCVNGRTKYDPTKVDYCSKTCYNNNATSTGCKCKHQGTRIEILDKMVEFRRFIVDQHNRWRNFIASGKETRGFAKSVSDMLVMNYDLELEYLARCYGRSTFNGFHDECRMLHNNGQSGQNLAGLSIKDLSFKLIKEQIFDWYDEVKDMQEDIYAKFRSRGAEKIKIGHFTAMCWGAANIVGCARIYTSDPKKDNFVNPIYVQTLICNYAVKDVQGTVNMLDSPVHIQGPPCSKCPKKKKYNKCNKKYTSLCGILEKIPIDEPFNFEPKISKEQKQPVKRKRPRKNNSEILKNNPILVVVLLVCLFW
ncbi:venom allergen 3-like [Tribolium madens]|uniref:venom allergen 3-like n=1 Tax=Tribolium madens TaxID=41895 RepID=UPI001CF76318|nr:venom allergen 3-like [Tribolium madens]